MIRDGNDILFSELIPKSSHPQTNPSPAHLQTNSFRFTNQLFPNAHAKCLPTLSHTHSWACPFSWVFMPNIQNKENKTSINQVCLWPYRNISLHPLLNIRIIMKNDYKYINWFLLLFLAINLESFTGLEIRVWGWVGLCHYVRLLQNDGFCDTEF